MRDSLCIAGLRMQFEDICKYNTVTITFCGTPSSALGSAGAAGACEGAGIVTTQNKATQEPWQQGKDGVRVFKEAQTQRAGN